MEIHIVASKKLNILSSFGNRETRGDAPEQSSVKRCIHIDAVDQSTEYHQDTKNTILIICGRLAPFPFISKIFNFIMKMFNEMPTMEK